MNLKIRVMKTERIFTISKMTPKNGKDSLWAIVDEFGHTMAQVWSEKEPVDVAESFGGTVVKTMVLNSSKELA